MKKPLVLAVLNFVFFGLGTLLLGKRPTLYGVTALVGGNVLRYEEIRISPTVTGALNVHWAVMTTALAVLGIGFAIEVFRDAKAA